MIRLATATDIPALLTVMRHHHEAEKLSWAIDPALLTRTLVNAITANDWLCLTAPRSILLAAAFDSPLGAGRLASELLVRAETPHQFTALREAFESWARDQRCSSVALGCTSNVPAFTRLYRRHGYRYAETIFQKEL